MEGATLWGVLLLFILSFMMCIEFENHWRGKFPLFLERMVYIPCSITAMILLCRAYHYAPRWLLTFLSFIGGISLELYLIHVQFVLRYVKEYHLGYCLTALLMIAISIPLAWVLAKVVHLIPLNGKEKGRKSEITAPTPAPPLHGRGAPCGEEGGE